MPTDERFENGKTGSLWAPEFPVFPTSGIICVPFAPQNLTKISAIPRGIRHGNTL